MERGSKNKRSLLARCGWLLLAVLTGGLATATSGPSASASPGELTNAAVGLPGQIPLEGYGLVEAFPGVHFDQPVALASPPGETNRLFVVERTGKIYCLSNLAAPVKTMFLDLGGRSNPASIETGLLGLAFHPGFATNGYFFVYGTEYMSTPGAQNRLHDLLSRFQVRPEEGMVADPQSEVIFLAQVDDSDQHNGGDIQFGPDGYLYVAIGERVGRDLNWPDQTPLDRDLQGAILRIDVDLRPGSLPANSYPASTGRYSIPSDNPFLNRTSYHGLAVNPAQVRTELFALGLRNPWRISFDPFTGALYVGDVGEGQVEEINRIVPGADYGWPYREGAIERGFAPPPEFHPEPPLYAYVHGWGSTNGECVIGGVVYQGTAMPWLTGRYLFGDLRSGHICALKEAGTNVTAERLVDATIGVSSFGVDPRDGEVLMTHLHDGVVLRLVYQLPELATNLPRTLAETGLFDDLVELKPRAGLRAYEVNVPLWSDGARKQRWFCLPDPGSKMGFNLTSAWSFPTGMVWVKHFELELTNGVPSSSHRLETRVLVNTADGFYGLTYRWGDSQTNAWLVSGEGMNERFTIRDETGAVLREQEWHYPSRTECMNCHTKWGGRALGFNTAQLNRKVEWGGGVTNQLALLAATGVLDPPPPAMAEWPALAGAEETRAPIEFRVRSYIQANCAQCHVPEGPTLLTWDARFTTPLDQAQWMVEGGIVQAGHLPDSRLYQRLQGIPELMPPIATLRQNPAALDMLSQWIPYLPQSPWSHRTIGDALHPGGTLISNEVYYVGGVGLDLRGDREGFEYLWRTFDQPTFQFLARVVAQDGAQPGALAGVMVRPGLRPLDGELAGMVSPDGATLRLRRQEEEAFPTMQTLDPLAGPQWLRVLRQGGEVRLFRSSDGQHWESLGDGEFPPPRLEVGLAASSGSRTEFNNVIFDSVSWLTIGLTSAAPAVMAQPAKATLVGAVESAGRQVTRVEFFDGDKKLGELTSKPYLFVASNLWSGAHTFTARAVDEGETVTISDPVQLSVEARDNFVALVKEEQSNGEDWMDHYGAQGVLLANDTSTLPEFFEAGLGEATLQVWEEQTDELRALLRVAQPGRTAAAWVADETCTLSLRVRDGDSHRVTLYFVDWDTADERVEEVECLDHTTGELVVSTVLSRFSEGVYLSFEVAGDIDIRLSKIHGPGVVLSGVFVDPSVNFGRSLEVRYPLAGASVPLPGSVELEADELLVQAEGMLMAPLRRVDFYVDEILAGSIVGAPFICWVSNLLAGSHTVVARAYDEWGGAVDAAPVTFLCLSPPGRATFLGYDRETRGDWARRYGTSGFLMPPLTNWWPTGFPYSLPGAAEWPDYGLDTNFLELVGWSIRVWPLLYNYTTLIYDLNLADGRPQGVSLYFLNDSVDTERVSVRDGESGRVLDTRVVTNGYGGTYLTWNAVGHVQFCISNLNSLQARVSGLFLDGLPGEAPVVKLTAPSDGQEVGTPARLLLQANAVAGEEAGIKKVEFHADGVLLGEVTQPPYRWLWNFPGAGVHPIFARGVSVLGVVSDSAPTMVRVQDHTPSQARFVGSDVQTQGQWRGRYGGEGYWFPGPEAYHLLPSSVDVLNLQDWVEGPDANSSQALVRPDAISRMLSFWTGEAWSLRLACRDGLAHRVTLYNYAPGWNQAASVILRGAGEEEGTVLDVRGLPNQDTGTYVTWEIQGEINVELSASPGIPVFVNGIFVDRGINLYQDWQTQWFSVEGLGDPNISGPLADPDWDGENNWTEFNLGHNPQVPERQPTVWITSDSGGVILHLMIGPEDSLDGVELEMSVDLAVWSPAGLVPSSSQGVAGPGTEFLFAIGPVSDEPRFFRAHFRSR